jgi:predicted nuclease of predicted toxin-antitoxin system
MKFLADQDVYAVTIRFLIDLGHEVVSASDLGMSRADDIDLLRIAHEQK